MRAELIAHADRIAEALRSARYTAGSTHHFYHYPARFSPEIARAIIESFSSPGDVVLDPFMGGGTAIVEGLALGRRMVGSDINALARFVTQVRTRPLSPRDRSRVLTWVNSAVSALRTQGDDWLSPGVANLPASVERFMSQALSASDRLPLERQRAFARCALLRLGQWALDCRDFSAPRRAHLAEKLPQLVQGMFAGLDEFVEACRASGTTKNEVAGRRLLLHRKAASLHRARQLPFDGTRPRLVFTSPPYPGVHVLYHRWQYRGRKETAAPYWIARVPDGFYGSYYTGGSRTPKGEERYFQMIRESFSSVRQVVARDAVVVQLIGFYEPARQLPRYLDAMTQAGFEETAAPGEDLGRLDRRVPNRKWYAKLQERAGAATEILLFHRVGRVGS